MPNSATESEPLVNGQANNSQGPTLITDGGCGAVLICERVGESIQETLHLLSLPGMRESIQKGMAEPLDKAAKSLMW